MGRVAVPALIQASLEPCHWGQLQALPSSAGLLTSPGYQATLNITRKQALPGTAAATSLLFPNGWRVAEDPKLTDFSHHSCQGCSPEVCLPHSPSPTSSPEGLKGGQYRITRNHEDWGCDHDPEQKKEGGREQTEAQRGQDICSGPHSKGEADLI